MNKKVATLIAVLVTAAWGSSFILMKNVAADVPALGFLTLRFGMAGLILSLVFCKKFRQFTKKTILESFVLGALLSGYMIFQVVGLRDENMSASNSAFITSMSVLMVPFMSAFLLKKRPSASNWVGVFLAIFGLVFVTGIYQGVGALGIGDLLTFLCAICVAVHIIVADKYLKESDPILLGVGQIVAAFILSFIAWTVQTPTSFMTVNYTPALIIAVVLTAVFCTCFAFTGQIVVQKHLPPARVAVIFTLEPVFAYLYALVIPGPSGVTEALTWFNVLGSLLIVSGMIISESGLLNRKNKHGYIRKDV